MSDDYISREALRSRVDEIIKINHLRPDYVWFTPNGVKVLALEIPAADVVERPRWIPVTDQLPDAYEDVLLKFMNNQAVGFIDRDGCWGVYSGDGFYTEVAGNEPKPTHWSKKLSEPPKEEA